MVTPSTFPGQSGADKSKMSFLHQPNRFAQSHSDPSQQDSGDAAKPPASYRVSLSSHQDMSLTYQASKVKGPDAATLVTDSELLQGSATILNFIVGRIALDQAEGATQEELQERLSQGLAGFKQGFAEAKTLLEGTGQLEGAVDKAISTLYDQVTETLALVEEQIAQGESIAVPAYTAKTPEVQAVVSDDDLTPPATNPAQPNGAQNEIFSFVKAPLDRSLDSVFGRPRSTIESLLNNLPQIDQDVIGARQSVRFGQRESFQFELTTQEGDAVRIQAQHQFAFAQALSYDGSQTKVSASAEEKNRFAFEVRGELNADEQQAIQALMTQVFSLAEDFYQGDVQAAFAAALELDYDSSEIANYSLKLRQTQVTQVETYQRFSKPVAYADNLPDALGPQPLKELLDSISRVTQGIVATLLDQPVYEASRPVLLDYSELLNLLSQSLDQQLEPQTPVRFSDFVASLTDQLEVLDVLPSKDSI